MLFDQVAQANYSYDDIVIVHVCKRSSQTCVCVCVHKQACVYMCMCVKGVHKHACMYVCVCERGTQFDTHIYCAEYVI